MFLKHIVYPVLVLALFAFNGTHAAADGDYYLPYLYAEESVFVCKDETTFNLLLQGEPIEALGEFCAVHKVVGVPEFSGWYFLDPPVWVDGTDDFVPIRKYVMETEEGTVRFAWPWPLDPGSVTFDTTEEEEFFEEEFHDEPPLEWPYRPLRDGGEVILARY